MTREPSSRPRAAAARLTPIELPRRGRKPAAVLPAVDEQARVRVVDASAETLPAVLRPCVSSSTSTS